MTFKEKLISAGKIAAVASVLTFGVWSCGSCVRTCSRWTDEREQKVQEQIITREFYNERPAVTTLYTKSYDFGSEAYIHDINKDGVADVIAYGPTAYWVSDDFDGLKSEREMHFSRCGAKVMTPEIRGAATKAMNANKDLSYLTAKTAYEMNGERK